ncbi:MAG: hypothetical protein AABP62_18910 [Planctomycetota bacterium]
MLLNLLIIPGCGDAVLLEQPVREKPKQIQKLMASAIPNAIHVGHPSKLRTSIHSDSVGLDRCRAALYAKAVSEPSFAVYTHLLLLDGEIASVSSHGGDQKILTILTDSQLLKSYLGRSSLVQTAHGVAYQWGEDGGESHRDQVLCALAQREISLDLPVVVDGKRFSIRDLLSDSIANFHLKQEELAWTAAAYVYYLSDVSSWTNKYGVTFRFDDLASALLNSSLSEASCGGMHIVASLTHILKAHRRSPIVTNRVAGTIEAFLDRCVAATANTQHSDGSWSSNWTHELTTRSHSSKALLDDSSSRTKLVLSGHLLEWTYALPVSDHLPGDVTEKASKYLAASLQAMTSEEIGDQFCPVTHAILALQN